MFTLEKISGAALLTAGSLPVLSLASCSNSHSEVPIISMSEISKLDALEGQNVYLKGHLQYGGVTEIPTARLSAGVWDSATTVTWGRMEFRVDNLQEKPVFVYLTPLHIGAPDHEYSREQLYESRQAIGTRMVSGEFNRFQDNVFVGHHTYIVDIGKESSIAR
jgi:hypothetical protein